MSETQDLNLVAPVANQAAHGEHKAKDRTNCLMFAAAVGRAPLQLRAEPASYNESNIGSFWLLCTKCHGWNSP